MNQKGQVSALPRNIVFLGIAAIVLVMSIVIVQEMRDTDLVAEAYTLTVSNETTGTITTTAYQLLCGSRPNRHAFAITAARNETSGLSITSGNYTLDATSGLVTNKTSIVWSDVHFDYTCAHADEAYNVANDSVVGLGTFGDFWVIIVLALVAAIVIGIIFGAFGGVRNNR